MRDVINIDKLKKVNSLANTLNRHGLAVNRMDAADLAREINGGGEMDYLKGLKVNKKQELEIVHTSNGQEMIIEKLQKPTKPAESNFMTKEQVESILQKFCDLFAQEMSKLDARLNGMELTVSYLQEQLSVANNQSASGEYHENNDMRNTGFNTGFQETQTTLGYANHTKEPENNVNLQVRPAQHGQAQMNATQQVAAFGSGKPFVSSEPVEKPTTMNRPAENPKPVGNNNPRTGGYESNDVSIEKFFYFGK
ncbi:MAG: hypothetical protein ABIG89_06865 [Candidatus Woesearchaeota archaeon]